MCRIESTVSNPLSHRHVWRHRGEFAKQLDSADLRNARDTRQEIVTLSNVAVAPN